MQATSAHILLNSPGDGAEVLTWTVAMSAHVAPGPSFSAKPPCSSDTDWGTGAFGVRLGDADTDAGALTSRAAGRVGRRTRSPPQFGQRPSKRSCAQTAQAVHLRRCRSAPAAPRWADRGHSTRSWGEARSIETAASSDARAAGARARPRPRRCSRGPSGTAKRRGRTQADVPTASSFGAPPRSSRRRGGATGNVGDRARDGRQPEREGPDRSRPRRQPVAPRDPEGEKGADHAALHTADPARQRQQVPANMPTK